MNNIVKRFSALKKEGKKAFIPYITAGDPDIDSTWEILNMFADAEADIIELGVPFSDPMADGPVIQKAMERALKSGTNLRDIFNLTKAFKEKHDIPIVLMGYYNIFYQYGLKEFGEDCATSGIDGVLTVDLPPEEAIWMKEILKKNKVSSIFLATPVSDGKRLKIIKKVAEGFIYFVSVTGVTGEREDLPIEIKENIKRIKEVINLPVVLGFGISGPDIIKKFYDAADGFIVGSAIVKRWHEIITGKIEKEGFMLFIKNMSYLCHNGFK